MKGSICRKGEQMAISPHPEKAQQGEEGSEPEGKAPGV